MNYLIAYHYRNADTYMGMGNILIEGVSPKDIYSPKMLEHYIHRIKEEKMAEECSIINIIPLYHRN